MTEIQFFQQLVKKTEKQYLNSPIGQKGNLAYSISATPFRIGRPLILGINWGGSGSDFKSQQKMPTSKDLTPELIRMEYKFLEKSRGYFNQYRILELDLDNVDFNYSNLCFFRSRAEKDLTFADYQNSYPLAKELIQFLKPKYILVFGITALNRLKDLSAAGELAGQEFLDSENKHRGFKGKFLGFDIYCLPHPNARVKSASRDEIWKKVFETS